MPDFVVYTRQGDTYTVKGQNITDAVNRNGGRGLAMIMDFYQTAEQARTSDWVFDRTRKRWTSPQVTARAQALANNRRHPDSPAVTVRTETIVSILPHRREDGHTIWELTTIDGRAFRTTKGGGQAFCRLERYPCPGHEMELKLAFTPRGTVCGTSK